MIVGRVLAWQIGAEVGDELTVLVPGRDMIAAGGRPVLQTFTVVGVFEVGLQDTDASLALVSLADAADLAGSADATPAGLRVRFDDVMSAPARTGELRAQRAAQACRCATGARSTRRISARSGSRRR